MQAEPGVAKLGSSGRVALSPGHQSGGAGRTASGFAAGTGGSPHIAPSTAYRGRNMSVGCEWCVSLSGDVFSGSGRLTTVFQH
jgi:hypothetical protein